MVPTERYCTGCARQVRCREDPAGSPVRLYCPNCGRHIATAYGHIVIV